MWRIARLICHNCGELENIVGHHWLKAYSLGADITKILRAAFMSADTKIAKNIQSSLFGTFGIWACKSCA